MMRREEDRDQKHCPQRGGGGEEEEEEALFEPTTTASAEDERRSSEITTDDSKSPPTPVMELSLNGKRAPRGGDSPPEGKWSWTLNWDYVTYDRDAEVPIEHPSERELNECSMMIGSCPRSPGDIDRLIDEGSGSYRLFTVRVVPRGFGNRLGTDSEEVFRTKRNYYQSGGGEI